MPPLVDYVAVERSHAARALGLVEACVEGAGNAAPVSLGGGLEGVNVFAEPCSLVVAGGVGG